jgi:hypothetical protein
MTLAEPALERLQPLVTSKLKAMNYEIQQETVRLIKLSEWYMWMLLINHRRLQKNPKALASHIEDPYTISVQRKSAVSTVLS